MTNLKAININLFLHSFKAIGFILLSSKRSYSKNNTESNDVKPMLIYDDADKDKINILSYNRNKIGVYRWVNKINGNTYIGSSVNISIRMYTYYSLQNLAKSNRLIDRALLKYGFSNFALQILEYTDKKNVLEKEQYYLDLYKPKYNIVEKAGFTLGYKHRQESLNKMRNFILSEEVRDKKALSTKNATAARKMFIVVEDIITKGKHNYSSLTEAATALGVWKS